MLHPSRSTSAVAALILLVLVSPLVLGQAPAAPAPALPPFDEWLSQLRDEAIARGIKPETVAQALQEAGVAAHVVADASDQAEDEHLWARGYFGVIPGGGGGVTGGSFRVSAAGTLGRASPSAEWPTARPR